MAGPTGLLRVVAHLSAGLMPIERFDRGVAVENPRGIQRFIHAFGQGRIHPVRAFGHLRRALGTFGFGASARWVRRQRAQRPPQAFVAEDLLHSQNSWRNGITPQTGHVGISPLPIQDRQQPST